MSKFIVASRQVTELDKTRILLEKRIKEVKDESKMWAEVATKAREEAKELRNLNEELKTDVLEKNTRLDHLQKRNNKLNALLEKAKGDAVAEFQASKQFTDLLDKNYATGFEDFRLDATENFPNLDFSSIKLNLGAATNSLIQTSSEDVNIEDDASTFLLLLTLRTMPIPPKDETLYVNLFFFFFLLSFLFFFRKEKCNSSTPISSMVLGRDFEQIFVNVFGRW